MADEVLGGRETAAPDDHRQQGHAPDQEDRFELAQQMEHLDPKALRGGIAVIGRPFAVRLEPVGQGEDLRREKGVQEREGEDRRRDGEQRLARGAPGEDLERPKAGFAGVAVERRGEDIRVGEADHGAILAR